MLADPVRLRQVLINLISNGVKYTPEHGCVQVKVTQGNSFAEGKASYSFVVKDNGIGMSEEFQKKLFEPFSREDNSMTNATQGTGLGLSIAKSIIAQMGGSIEGKEHSGERYGFSCAAGSEACGRREGGLTRPYWQQRLVKRRKRIRAF